ncbi:hypothetical protein BGW80DRAFT_1322154 [Lactifluus volemus]|nr:hypothetical protein BGW80DRAFT_1322154 [Lactifluus volemus]
MVTISLLTALLRHLATGLTETCLAKASHALRLTPGAHKQLHTPTPESTFVPPLYFSPVRVLVCAAKVYGLISSFRIRASRLAPRYVLRLQISYIFSTLQKDAVSELHKLICNRSK